MSSSKKSRNKPYNCSNCHTKDPLDFAWGFKSLCVKCKKLGFHVTPVAPYCKCGESNPDNFYSNRNSSCKKCYNRKSIINETKEETKNQSKMLKPHKCLKCNETDPENFGKGMKSLCKKCYKTHRVRSLILHPVKVDALSNDNQTLSSSDVDT
jgi:hypothetical protein